MKIYQRSKNGLSIIEMLVSIVILGIAVAGLTATLWINGLFAIRQFNKVDNVADANHFLEILGRDVRNAASIGYMSGSFTWTDTCSRYTVPIETPNGTNTNSANYVNNNTLILQIPHIGANGLPLGVPTSSTTGPPVPVYDTVIYQVSKTSASTEIITRTLIPNSLVGGNNVQTNVLQGVVGPTIGPEVDKNFHVFDYEYGGNIIPPGSEPFENQAGVNEMKMVTSVIVNLDLQCSNSSNPATHIGLSTLGIRQQFVMRNQIALER